MTESGNNNEPMVMLGVLVFFAAFIGLAIWNPQPDLSEGIDYGSGDEPHEVRPHVCRNDGSPCPIRGFTWDLPPAGRVETRFDLDDPTRTDLNGGMHLSVVYRGGGLRFDRDCPAVVVWSATAADRQITENTLSVGRSTQPVSGAMPPGARTMTLAAKRTDGESCTARLHWRLAGLA